MGFGGGDDPDDLGYYGNCVFRNGKPSSKADPKGLDCWAWPRQIVSKVYESGARKFTQTQNWGSWSVAHAVSDSTLDLTVSITNSWNESIDIHDITISLFGSEVGPAQFHKRCH